MASGGGKGGKAAGEGHGAGRAGGEGHGAPVRWLAEDIRETEQGRQEKPAVQPKLRKLFTCKNCEDLCCGLARELVSEAFELEKITMSRKVIFVHCLVFGIYFTF